MILYLTASALLTASLNDALSVGAESIGLCWLAHGWRRKSLVLCIPGALLLGLAVTVSQPALLLLIPLLLAANDLPRRWSWILPVIFALPVTLVAWFDWHHFGIRPDTSAFTAIATLNPWVVAHGMLNQLEACTVFILPIAAVGLGLLTRSSGRWGVFLIGALLPSIAIFLIDHSATDHALAAACVPLILSVVWLVGRSAITAGIIVSIAAVISIHPLVHRLDPSPVSPPSPSPAVHVMEPSQAIPLNTVSGGV